jgi:hypothetical protein
MAQATKSSNGKSAASVASTASAARDALAARQAAAAGTKAAGRAVTLAAERVKTPLIVGAGGVAGVVGGLVIKNRSGHSRSSGLFSDGKLDFGAVKEAAQAVGSWSQQVAGFADAMNHLEER